MLTWGSRWTVAVGILTAMLVVAPAFGFRQMDPGTGDQKRGVPAPAAGSGACCFGDGTCVDLPSEFCDLGEGMYQGDGTNCVATICTPFGACCYPGLACLVSSEPDCTATNGRYQGDSTSCGAGACPVVGACCLPMGGCDLVEHDACVVMGGVYQGVDAECMTTQCTGACSFENTPCLDDMTMSDCMGIDGDFLGHGSVCADFNLPAVVECVTFSVDQAVDLVGDRTNFPQFDPKGGRRVLQSVSVRVEGDILLQIELTNLDGQATDSYIENGELATLQIPALAPDPNLFVIPATSVVFECTEPGACCFVDGSCLNRSQAVCVAAGGVFQGAGVVCSVPVCVPAAGQCCFQDGTCQVVATQADCFTIGSHGVFQGYGTDCTSGPCRAVMLASGETCVYGERFPVRYSGSGAGAMSLPMDDLSDFVGLGTVAATLLHAGEVDFDGSNFVLVQIPHALEGKITVIYEYALQQGACCLCDGTCSIQSQRDCEADPQFVMWTPDVDCAAVVCNPFLPCVIDGVTSVCPATAGIMYSIDSPVVGATYEWTISDDGLFCDGSTMQTGTSVCVDAADVCNGGFTLDVTVTLGNCVNTCNLFVAVVDTTPPFFTVFPADDTVECDGAGNVAALAAFLAQGAADDLCGTAMVTPGDCILSDGCGDTGTCTVTFTATDECGNTATADAVFTIEDTTPPMIACCLADEVLCPNTLPPPDLGCVTASDLCGPVVITFDGDVTDGLTCPETITRTYRATDACGLFSECTQIITLTCPPSACCLPDDTCILAIEQDCIDAGGMFLGVCVPCIPCESTIPRVGCTEKGSLLVFSKVEIRWDVTGTNFLQDTFLSITNDFPGSVRVMMYFINGDPPLEADGGERAHPGWNWVDNGILLTGNQPAYWSALTGQPGPGPGNAVSPFTALDPELPRGRPAMDGTTDRVLRGYVLAWAHNTQGDEIRWNHLAGTGTLLNYDRTYAWEYNACAFPVIEDLFAHGVGTGTPGVLNLDGLEYGQAFSELLLNFQAANSMAWDAPGGPGVMTDTDLTLHPVTADVRQETTGPITTDADILIWNENESKFSGTNRCITCWDQTLISFYDAPNHFLRMFLQTDHGKARIDGIALDDCNVFDDLGTPEDETVTSVPAALLGVAARMLTINADLSATAGTNLFGMGLENALIQYDHVEPPDEAQLPPDPTREEIDAFLDAMIRRLTGEAVDSGDGR